MPCECHYQVKLRRKSALSGVVVGDVNRSFDVLTHKERTMAGKCQEGTKIVAVGQSSLGRENPLVIIDTNKKYDSSMTFQYT